MSKKIVKTVYTLAELVELHKQGEVSQRALDRAKDWLREGQTDHEWWDYTFEMWTSALEQVGFENANISFSGFWSQGDGASFTANLDIAKLIDFLSKPIEPTEGVQVVDGKEDFRSYVVHKIRGKVTNPRYDWLHVIPDYLDGKVERTSHHYSHEGTCRAYVSLNSNRYHTDVEKLVEEFEQDVEELRRDLCRAIYKSLEEEYEYLTSDESIMEMAEANEYTFTIYGEREG